MAPAGFGGSGTSNPDPEPDDASLLFPMQYSSLRLSDCRLERFQKLGVPYLGVLIIRIVLQQQHCLRNHWFKKLSPTDSRAKQIHIYIYIHKMRIQNMKSRVPWTRCANFLFCSFSFCLRWCCSHKKRNQETKGVDFVFQRLGAKPLQRKPRNESTEGFCAPLNFLVWWFFPLWQSLISAFTKPPKPSKADAKALLLSSY